MKFDYHILNQLFGGNLGRFSRFPAWLKEEQENANLKVIELEKTTFDLHISSASEPV